MSKSLSSASEASGSSRAWTILWRVLFAAWLVVLCVVPDPRALGAPEWLVRQVVTFLGVDDPAARLLATTGLRVAGIVGLSILLVLALGPRRDTRPHLASLILVPVLAAALTIATMWINYGYFPVKTQWRPGVLCAILGTWSGLVLRRSRAALAGVVALAALLFVWGTATGASDSLTAAARATGRHVLDVAGTIPDGDAGFAKSLEVAFAFAAEESGAGDPVLANEAAILALGVLLGEERVADVAKRAIDRTRMPEVAVLRRRLTVRGRRDWKRHFWVSAGLTILTGEDRTLSIGLIKEMMDAAPGKKGFSFSDLASDGAGTWFALAATRDVAAALAMQERIRAGVDIDDFFPEVGDLPERIKRDRLREEFGGVGGAGTQEVIAEIRRRLTACAALTPGG